MKKIFQATITAGPEFVVTVPTKDGIDTTMNALAAQQLTGVAIVGQVLDTSPPIETRSEAEEWVRERFIKAAATGNDLIAQICDYCVPDGFAPPAPQVPTFNSIAQAGGRS